MSYNQTQGTFSAFGQYTSGAQVGVNYSDTLGNQIQIDFSFPSGTLPATGLYSGNISINSNQPSSPFNENLSSGSFEVTEIQYDENGVLVSVAMNIEGAISGTVRYNQPQSAPAAYSPVADTSSLSQLSMQSGPGDYVGQGKNWNYTGSDGTFQADYFQSRITIVFTPYDQSGTKWELDFAIEGGEANALTVGTYVTTSNPTIQFSSGNNPYLSVTVLGDGCESSVGQFQVLKVSYGLNGQVNTFEATFDLSSIPGIGSGIEKQGVIHPAFP